VAHKRSSSLPSVIFFWS